MPAPLRNHHPRNKHQTQYDIPALVKAHAPLGAHIFTNKYGTETINFSNLDAVLDLNTALLKSQYKLDYWNLPAGFLCPPVPGRADYIHHIADLLAGDNPVNSIRTSKVNILDVGCGASIIYPIIGNAEYKWSFIGSDINDKALASGQDIIDKNKEQLSNIKLVKQKDALSIFRNIIPEDAYIDALICNPPFYKTALEAESANRRKNTNLKLAKKSNRNFGGQSDELWCEGGEYAFTSDLIAESKERPTSCLWFTTLVSRHELLQDFEEKLKRCEVEDIKVLDLSHGNKKSRILCWTYLTEKQQKAWAELRSRM